MRVSGRTGRPPSPVAQARREAFVALWNEGVPGAAIGERLGIECVRSYVSDLRHRGFHLASRQGTRRRSGPVLTGNAVARRMAEDALLRSGRIPPAIVYDGTGRVVGEMDAFSREVRPCTPA